MNKVGVLITTEELRVLMISIGEQLTSRAEVVWLARDNDVVEILRKVGVHGEIVVLVDLYKPVSPGAAHAIAPDLERRYGTTMTMIIHTERGVGQGFLLNADRHPHIKRSTWSTPRKQAYIISELMMYERIFNLHDLKMVVSYIRPYTLDLVCKARGVVYVNLTAARYGDRMMWCDQPAGNKVGLRGLMQGIGDAWEINKALEG